jgi:hypothetical protein
MSSHSYEEIFSGTTQVKKKIAWHYRPDRTEAGHAEQLTGYIVAHFETGKEEPVGYSVKGTNAPEDRGHDIVHLNGKHVIVGYSSRTSQGALHFDVFANDPVGYTKREGDVLEHRGDVEAVHRGALLVD